MSTVKRQEDRKLEALRRQAEQEETGKLRTTPRGPSPKRLASKAGRRRERIWLQVFDQNLDPLPTIPIDVILPASEPEEEPR